MTRVFHRAPVPEGTIASLIPHSFEVDMNDSKVILLAVVLLFIALLHGCTGSSDPAPLVTVQKVGGLYYRVDINMSGASRYEIGRQYALQIRNTVPNYESLLDSVLKGTIEKLKEADEDIDFNTLNARAHVIYSNIPAEYQQEIQGMQSVFSDTDDTVGNGRLSQNKLLIYQLGPDIARAFSCSASAAFGNGTTTGKTILGRNLEWDDETLPYLSPLETIVMLHNGNRSVVLFGFLGQVPAISGFNASKVFGAILDSDTLADYELSGGERSYAMDLRYALENQTSLHGIADYLTGKKYAYSFNIFLADENTAAVLEVAPTKGFSGLRTATSTLKTETIVPIAPWNFFNAIALVNWFTLPGTAENSAVWLGNVSRWESFITLYENAFASGGKVDMDVMKRITSYPGPKNNGKATEGAIWRYNDENESNMQSIIINMETLETWVSFQPEGPALTRPNYIRLFESNPFM